MTEQQFIPVNEGRFTIHVLPLKKDADEPSVMGSYISKTAIITNQADTLYATFMFLDHQTVTGFQVENEAGEWIESVDKQINEDKNNRFEMFQLGRLTTALRARVQYEVKHEGKVITGDEALRLDFVEDSLAEIE